MDHRSRLSPTAASAASTPAQAAFASAPDPAAAADHSAVQRRCDLEMIRVVYLINCNEEPCANLPVAERLVFAAKRDDLERVRRIASSYDDPARFREDAQLAMIAAAHKGCIGVIAWLASQGVSVNCTQAAINMRPLDLAVMGLQRDTVRLLRQLGADMNHPSGPKNTLHPLLFAGMFGQLDMIRELVALGADMHHPVGEDSSVLLELAKLERKEHVMALMLELGADPNHARGKTLLATAVMARNATLVELLLRAGADPNLCDSEGLNALSHATRINCAALITLLERHGGVFNNNRRPLLPRAHRRSRSLLARQSGSRLMAELLARHCARRCANQIAAMGEVPFS